MEEQVVLNRETKLAWNNVLDHLSFVSASAIDSNLAHIPAAVLSANRALVRDNWALIRASNQNEVSHIYRFIHVQYITNYYISLRYEYSLFKYK